MLAKKALFLTAALTCIAPTQIGSFRFIYLTTPLSVAAEKSHPPYIAFQESEKGSSQSAWDRMDLIEAVHLGSGVAAQVLPSPTVRLAQMESRLTLEEMIVSQETAPHEDTFRQYAQRIIAQTDSAGAPTAPVIVGSVNAAGEVVPSERSVARVEVLPTKETIANKEIVGHFLLENLAFLNGHRLEIRRRHEGIYEEVGQIQTLESTYAIQVKNPTGEIVMTLRDEQGRLLGESSYPLSRLNRHKGESSPVQGPRFVLKPKTDVAGRAVSARTASVHPSAGASTLASLDGRMFMGSMKLPVSKSGDFEMDRIERGSFSVVSMVAQDHAKTSMLVGAGFRSNIPLFPQSMMQAMKEIVSEQRKQNLNDPESSIIWGQALVDGKPVSGIQVEVESVPGYEPVYFNEWMLPDPTLHATSSNGTYAFIGVPEGFQSLVGRRGDQYFSHQNVIVQKQTVAVGNLESTLETEQAILRVFDAFTGQDRSAEVVHQGVPESIWVGGMSQVTLGALHRLSVSRVQPGQPYAAANYYSDDEQAYVHYPLVRGDWIDYMKAATKTPDLPGATVVGFVLSEDFDVQAIDPEERAQVVFFDSTGKPTNQGYLGGGFIIFGLSPGVREILVTKQKTGEIAAQTIAADEGSLSVLRFQAD